LERDVLSIYPCIYELERWAEFQIMALEGMGYSRSSPIVRAMEGQTRARSFTSKLPIGIHTRGFDEYLLVERALNYLGQEYRDVAVTEYAAPLTIVGKSMAKRASRVGISIHMYRRRLKQIHAEVCRIFDI
jgi:hypothetical protein